MIKVEAIIVIKVEAGQRAFALTENLQFGVQRWNKSVLQEKKINTSFYGCFLCFRLYQCEGFV